MEISKKIRFMAIVVLIVEIMLYVSSFFRGMLPVSMVEIDKIDFEKNIGAFYSVIGAISLITSHASLIFLIVLAFGSSRLYVPYMVITGLFIITEFLYPYSFTPSHVLGLSELHYLLSGMLICLILFKINIKKDNVLQ